MTGFLSHCVSHSLCGPPRASWAAGAIGALGPRQRWKPLSVPTLPGKPPPWQLPCHPPLGWRVGVPPPRGTLSHPLKGLYPLVHTVMGRGKEERERVRKGEPPRFRPSRMWLLLQRPSLAAPFCFAQWKNQVLVLFGGDLSFPRMSLCVPQLPNSLHGPEGAEGRALAALWCLLSQRQLGGKREAHRPL